MEEKVKNILLLIIKFDTFISKPLIKWILIPSLLIIIWLTLSLLFNDYESFTTLSYIHSNREIVSIPKNRILLKGNKIVGKFVGEQNGLGIISVRLDSKKVHHSELEDYLVFEIKEENSPFYYKSINKIGAVKEPFFYTFGFPRVADSKSKTFTFTITSLKGNNNNYVFLKNDSDTFMAKYKLDKLDLAQTKSGMAFFMLEKLHRFFVNKYNLIETNGFFLPMFIYFSWILFLKKMLINKKFFTVLVLILMSLDSILIKENYPLIYFGLIDLWIITTIRNHYKADASFKIAFLFSILMLPYLYSQNTDILDKFSTWVFTFLIIGLIMELNNKLVIKRLWKIK